MMSDFDIEGYKKHFSSEHAGDCEEFMVARLIAEVERLKVQVESLQEENRRLEYIEGDNVDRLDQIDTLQQRADRLAAELDQSKRNEQAQAAINVEAEQKAERLAALALELEAYLKSLLSQTISRNRPAPLIHLGSWAWESPALLAKVEQARKDGIL